MQPPRDPHQFPDTAHANGRGNAFVRLGPEDADAIAEIEGRCFHLPWSAEQFRLAFAQPVFSVFALKREATIVAYVSVYHTADELEILNIAVSSEQRREGLGGQLLGLALREATKMGIVRSVLEVRPGNAPAIALYQAYGYAQVGRRPRYYLDTGEDALIYALEFELHSPTEEPLCP